jgi:hypothetical protein
MSNIEKEGGSEGEEEEQLLPEGKRESPEE